MGLQAQVVPAGEIDESWITAMARIMQAYYLNVDGDEFRVDLREKDLVILLQENGAVRGFSTWMLTPHEAQGHAVNVIFSGDTIIEREYWRSMALPIAWGKLMLSVLAQHPDRELYWLLTSKGYKTYRFLPVFFRTFYPSFQGATPSFEKALIEDFARRRFGKRFNPLTGVVAAREVDQRLAPGVADITGARRKDPHVAFFEKMNPGHASGDELVCLAPCRPDNIRPFIMKHLKP